MTKSFQKSIKECPGYGSSHLEMLAIWGEELPPSLCSENAQWKVNDRHYCLMHAPTIDKTEKFETLLLNKLAAKDYNFRGAWFPQAADFSGCEFEGDVNFDLAVFNEGAKFTEAKFSGEKTTFVSTHFKGEKTDFSSAKFDGGNVFFEAAHFNSEAAHFNEALFGGNADFTYAQFDGERVEFNKAKFGKNAWFQGTQFNAEGASFIDAQFSGDTVSFSEAVFSRGGVSFDNAKFSGGDAYFKRTRFMGGSATFSGVQFSGGKVDAGSAHFGAGADFSYAQFSGGPAWFESALFAGGDVDFRNAQFSGGDAIFNTSYFGGGDVWFDNVRFEGDAHFSLTQFLGGIAYFRDAHFKKDAYFEQAVFAKQFHFKIAVFEKRVFFDRSVFQAGSLADFRLARFSDLVRFVEIQIAEGAEFYFGEVLFEKPERIHFHSISNLEPRWFVNVDSSKFNFENAEFVPLSKRGAVAQQLEKTRNLLDQLDKRTSDGKSPNELLTIACRRLAENAEQNNRYGEAMEFRYMAMDVNRRRSLISQRSPFSLQWWYWLSSGYGEKWRRALMIVFLVWLIPFLFYTSALSTFRREFTDKDVRPNGIPKLEESAAKNTMLDLPGLPTNMDAAFYSLNVMSFQKPEPKPANESWLTRLVVTLQTILGPVQATLLLLAIRRKFMR